jgi:hypothetical protein
MGEHKDKYEKPWGVWAYEQCRECTHFKYMHLLDMPTGFTFATGIEKPFGTIGQCQQIVAGGGFCFCSEFMPPDNLDYIELLAKKKGIIPEDNI